MRPLTLLLTAVALSGCGGDEAQNDSPSPVTAAEFISCFDLKGYEAVEPERGEESIYSYRLRADDFEVESANVRKKGMLSLSAFLSFFEDEDAREEATEKVPPKAISGPPPAIVGNVVIGYLDDDSEKETGEAIEQCLR